MLRYQRQDVLSSSLDAKTNVVLYKISSHHFNTLIVRFHFVRWNKTLNHNLLNIILIIDTYYFSIQIGFMIIFIKTNFKCQEICSHNKCTIIKWKRINFIKKQFMFIICSLNLSCAAVFFLIDLSENK